MIPRTTVIRRSVAIPWCIAAVLAYAGPGCNSDDSARPGWTGPLPPPGELPSAILGEKNDAGASPLPCTAPVSSARPHEAGNYDNRSCNVLGCHEDMLGGGWVYGTRNGPPAIAGATITISNIDGTTVKAYSGKDGFFQIKSEIKPPYKVCVSECPGTSCSLLPHPNGQCQTSTCHGTNSQRIYVSQPSVAPTISVSATSGGAGNCTPPTYGGPYTHSEYSFGQQPCSMGGCHCPPKPVFKGGYLYEGPTSGKTVAGATITLVSADGTAVTVITGPDGMFFFGTVASTSTSTAFTAPYTACVSKCPLTLCSTTNGHKTTGDCQTSDCHGPDLSMKVYLR